MMHTVHDFSGSVVLVAGAASGIGRATALACVQAGAQVLALDVDGAGLAVLPTQNMQTKVVDIADAAQVDASVQAWQAQFGRVDAAVLTSAVQVRKPIDEMDNSTWQRHLDVNVSGIFYLLRALFPLMKAQQHGAIVTFTSGLATAGWAGAAAYAASKAALIGLVKSAALELRPFGVRINAVSPGLVATPVFLDAASADELTMYENTLGVSTPEEVVPSLMFLISDAARTLSGNIFERRLIPRVQIAQQTL